MLLILYHLILFHQYSLVLILNIQILFHLNFAYNFARTLSLNVLNSREAFYFLTHYLNLYPKVFVIELKSLTFENFALFNKNLLERFLFTTF